MDAISRVQRDIDKEVVRTHCSRAARAIAAQRIFRHLPTADLESYVRSARRREHSYRVGASVLTGVALGLLTVTVPYAVLAAYAALYVGTTPATLYLSLAEHEFGRR